MVVDSNDTSISHRASFFSARDAYARPRAVRSRYGNKPRRCRQADFCSIFALSSFRGRLCETTRPTHTVDAISQRFFARYALFRAVTLMRCVNWNTCERWKKKMRRFRNCRRQKGSIITPRIFIVQRTHRSLPLETAMCNVGQGKFNYSDRKS